MNPNTPGSGMVFLGAADWGWGPSDPVLSATQMRLSARYRAWFDRFRLLFPHPTPDVSSDINEVDGFVRRWVERPDKWDHSIPRTIEAAKQVAAAQLARFDRLLDTASHTGSDTLRLVPDTNALIRNPDLGSYARAVSSSTFTVHLLPTVLAELDDLKDRGRTPELRDLAQGVVRRLKGLRDKGNLAAGVKLTNAITVQTQAREVDVRAVLDWLDPSVPDDRVLAAALRLQSDHPAGGIVLVTSDLNLQNKADAAGLPYIETPATTASLRANFTASLHWPDERVPRVTLTNRGPAIARAIEYAVVTLPDQPPPHFKAGPWDVNRLRVGESDEREVWGFYAGRHGHRDVDRRRWHARTVVGGRIPRQAEPLGDDEPNAVGDRPRSPSSGLLLAAGGVSCSRNECSRRRLPSVPAARDGERRLCPVGGERSVRAVR